MTPRSPKHETPDTLQVLSYNLAAAGDRDALISFDGEAIKRRSFRDLAVEVESWARILASKGIEADDPVILCGPGGAEWIVACLAVLRCGACAVPVDTQLAADTLRHVLKDSAARLALVAASAERRVGAIFREAGVEVMPLAGEGRLHALSAVDLPTGAAGDRAILFYTSGTTGPPKGVLLTHRNIAFQIGVLADAGLVSTDDRVLLPLPLHHVYPVVIGVFAPLALRLAVVLPDGFTGTRILAALQRGETTLMIGVPRLYDALVDGVTNQMRRRGRLAALLFGGCSALLACFASALVGAPARCSLHRFTDAWDPLCDRSSVAAPHSSRRRLGR